MRLGPFERLKYLRETSNGAGLYTAEVGGWYRDTKCAREHAAPDNKGIGEGATPDEARSKACSSLLANERDRAHRCCTAGETF